MKRATRERMEIVPNMPKRQVKRAFRTPKACIVGWARIEKDGVEIGLRCRVGEYEHENFYIHAPGARSIRLPSGSIEGIGARAGFVVSPKHVLCEKAASDTTVRCKLYHERGFELGGARKRKQQRR